MWGASIVYNQFLANLKESAFNVFTMRKFAWIQYQNQTRLIKNGVASWMNLVKHVLWHRPDWYTILNCFAKAKTIVNKKHFLLEYISLLQLVVRLSVIAFVFHSFIFNLYFFFFKWNLSCVLFCNSISHLVSSSSERKKKSPTQQRCTIRLLSLEFLDWSLKYSTKNVHTL